MYTQTTVSMYHYGAMGKEKDDWGQHLPHPRYLNIFKKELERLDDKQDEPRLFKWGLPNDADNALSDIEKKDILVTLQLGWAKLAEPGNWAAPWTWTDIEDVERSVAGALTLVDAHLNFMCSRTLQGPLRPEDAGCTKEAITQAMLEFGSSSWLLLEKTLIQDVLPRLAEAKLELRGRMGQVDPFADCLCVKCQRNFSGIEGFVVIDATRRDGKGNGIHCLKCIGH